MSGAHESVDSTEYHKRDLWIQENTQFVRPHYRLEKAARIVNGIARGRNVTLLDVGCGPATLSRLLDPAIEYYGVDIAIQSPAPNLLEADLLEDPIGFKGRKFDVVLAQGFFEYVGEFQSQKFGEMAEVLNNDGTVIVSYTNYGHRAKNVYWLYNNIQPISEFRVDLSRYFKIRRFFPSSYNWVHTEPKRRIVKAVNMHLNANLPFAAPILAVEYFFVCSPL